MSKCRRCAHEIQPGRDWCPQCGARSDSPVAKATNRAVRYLAILVASILGAALVVTGYWWVEFRPRMKRLENPLWGNEPSRFAVVATPDSIDPAFDLVIQLPTGPRGLAFDGTTLITSNREDPWGFLRVRSIDGEWKVQTVPVIETEYAQRMSLNGVAWNGANLVGITNGDWFRQNGQTLFTNHDVSDHQVTDWRVAPPNIGALAWDGREYWVATRNNTETSGEEAKLIRLDAELNVLDEFAPPGVGCQGLTWDGELLWAVDVFTDTIYAINITALPPTVVRSHHTGIGYLSGIAYDGQHLWVAEYGNNRLYRVATSTRTAWIEGVEPAGDRAPAPRPDIAALIEKLRSNEWSERNDAESELRRKGLPIPVAHFENPFRKDDIPSKVDLDVFDLEVHGNDLVASWDLYIGEDFFSTNGRASEGPITIPLFVRYEVNVSSPSLVEDIEIEYKPLPGRSLENGVVLASNLRPGRYAASIFIHIQYVDAEDGPKILNLSEESLTVEK